MGNRNRIRSSKFFRSKLLVTPPENIPLFLDGMKREQKELRHMIHEIMWNMRGGLTREEAWTLSPQERADILEDIKKRVETVEKTGLPLI